MAENQSIVAPSKNNLYLTLSPTSADSYRDFLRIKSLPRYSFQGRLAEVPAEYAHLIGRKADRPSKRKAFTPSPFLFDYQRDIVRLAARKQKFAIFAQCGLGKSLIFLELARYALANLPPDRCALIVTPPNVIRQFLAEAQRFYGDTLLVERVRAKDLPGWLEGGKGRLGMTNYEAIAEGLSPGRLGALILDESSMLKSHYGAYGLRLIEMGKGLPFKWAGTGTPAPNDRIEYANHAVFLDQCPTVNSFLARYFVNRGQTGERWELKAHALRPFYRALSHWCIFLSDPSVYGWKDNVGNIPPFHVHVHDVPLTEEQRERVSKAGGDIFGTPGGITSRAKLSQLAKGRFEGEDVPTNKPEYLRNLVGSWPAESTIVWCLYNREQDTMERAFPGCASIRGDTPELERERLLDDFLAGRRKVLVTKPKVLGYGLNLQIATRQVFSGLVDSYESFWQAVKRSNRVGSTLPLNVHIPVTCVERAMVETVLAKASRVADDEREQERIFKESSCLKF